jgi:hypothetical protein
MHRGVLLHPHYYQYKTFEQLLGEEIAMNFLNYVSLTLKKLGLILSLNNLYLM